MADRKPFLAVAPVNEELEELLRNTRHRVVTEEELREQRISFAFGNAFSDSTTKEKCSTSSAKDAASYVGVCRKG